MINRKKLALNFKQNVLLNSVITNSLGPTNFVRKTGFIYVLKLLFWAEYYVRYNRIFFTIVFVLTEFHLLFEELLVK